MGYVILTRNPRNKKVVAITDDDQHHLAEFETYDDAEKAARNTTVCRAWGYDIAEVLLTSA